MYTKKKPKYLRVGHKFTAKRTVPYFVQEVSSPKEEVLLELMVGEKAQIIGYNPERDLYKLLNLSVESDDAQFELREAEVLLVQDKKPGDE